jgi:hypothetical protein
MAKDLKAKRAIISAWFSQMQTPRQEFEYT